MMGLFEIISLVLNLVLGSGFLITFVTLRSVKAKADAEARKAVAEAKKQEISNMASLVQMWQDYAVNMGDKHNELLEQVEKLRSEVNRLRLVNNKIVRLLDRLTPENMNEMVQKIKNEIDAEEALHNSSRGIADCRV